MPEEIAEELQQAAEAADLSRPAKEVDEVVEVPAERAAAPMEGPAKKVAGVEITGEKPDGQVGAEGEIRYSAAKLGAEGEEVVITKEQRANLEQKIELFYNWIGQYQEFARRGGIALPREIEEFSLLYKRLGKENFLLYSKNFAMATLLMDRMEFINTMGFVQYISTAVRGVENIPPEKRDRAFKDVIDEGKLHEFIRIYEDRLKKVGAGLGLFGAAPFTGLVAKLGIGAVAGAGVGTGVGAVVGAGPAAGYGIYRLIKSATTYNFVEVKQTLAQFPEEFQAEQIGQFLGRMPEWKGIIDYFDPKTSSEATVKTMLDMAEMKMNLYKALGVPEALQGSSSWWEAAFSPQNLTKVGWLLGRDRMDNLRRLTPADQDFGAWWGGLGDVSQRMEYLLKADTETFKSLLGSQVREIVGEVHEPGLGGVIERVEAKLAALKMTPEEWQVEKQGKIDTVAALKKLVDELPGKVEVRRVARDDLEAKVEGYKAKKSGLKKLHEAYDKRINEKLTPVKNQLEEDIKGINDNYGPRIVSITGQIQELERIVKPDQRQRNELARLRRERDRLNEEKMKLLNPLTTELAKKESEIQAVLDKLGGLDTQMFEGEGLKGELKARNKQLEDEEERLNKARETITTFNKEIAEGPPKLSERQITLLTCGKNSLENMDLWLGRATTRAVEEKLTVGDLTLTEERIVKVKAPDGEAADVPMFGGHQEILRLIFNPANEQEWWAASQILDPDALLKIYKNRFGTPGGMNFQQTLEYVRQNVTENQFKMAYLDIIWHIRNKLESTSGLVIPEAEEGAAA